MGPALFHHGDGMMAGHMARLGRTHIAGIGVDVFVLSERLEHQWDVKDGRCPS